MTSQLNLNCLTRFNKPVTPETLTKSFIDCGSCVGWFVDVYTCPGSLYRLSHSIFSENYIPSKNVPPSHQAWEVPNQVFFTNQFRKHLVVQYRQPLMDKHVRSIKLHHDPTQILPSVLHFHWPKYCLSRGLTNSLAEIDHVGATGSQIHWLEFWTVSQIHWLKLIIFDFHWPKYCLSRLLLNLVIEPLRRIMVKTFKGPKYNYNLGVCRECGLAVYSTTRQCIRCRMRLHDNCGWKTASCNTCCRCCASPAINSCACDICSCQECTPDFACDSHASALAVYATYNLSANSRGIDIRFQDIRELEPEQSVGSEIIDFFLWYTLLQHSTMLTERRVSVHYIGVLQSQKLFDSNPLSPPFTAVASWNRHVDLFGCDYIYVPIHGGAHWSMALICFPGSDRPKILTMNLQVDALPQF
jgi:hypothetical protein